MCGLVQASTSRTAQAAITEEADPADAAKAAGNKAFAQGNFAEVRYLHCIQTSSEVLVLGLSCAE